MSDWGGGVGELVNHGVHEYHGGEFEVPGISGVPGVSGVFTNSFSFYKYLLNWYRTIEENPDF